VTSVKTGHLASNISVETGLLIIEISFETRYLTSEIFIETGHWTSNILREYLKMLICSYVSRRFSSTDPLPCVCVSKLWRCNIQWQHYYNISHTSINFLSQKGKKIWFYEITLLSVLTPRNFRTSSPIFAKLGTNFFTTRHTEAVIFHFPSISNYNMKNARTWSDNNTRTTYIYN
jgi:hypothetical protein